ncbi:hypothetical protein Acr_11g0011150 [Actinidia rufa]|uniref:Integrase catalytic domain-containing protein n=1 Tax=Actinidia rufa TaxID=165716 RepID=A0A7J0FF54_9ERIC|nr:hypothetical protein Acr_11g0011150 [Actinidia rufa]
MHEVLSVHSLAKKPRVVAAELRSLTFTKADLERVQPPHYNPLVIHLRMNNYDVRWVLVDTGSLVEVMYYDLFKQFKLTQSDLRPVRAPLVSFNAWSHWLLGMVTLKVQVESQEVAAKQCCLTTVSMKVAMKEVQLVKEEHEVLKNVERNLEAKVVKDLVHFKLDEPSSDHFFLTGANLKNEREPRRRSTIEHIDAVIEEVETLKEESAITECELALQEFKKYLTQPSLLSMPDEGELLYVYLAVLEHAVSSVLLREVDDEQHPIYFVSKMFMDYQTSRDEGSMAGPSENQPAPSNPEVTLESSQVLETVSMGWAIEGAEVISEPPQIDLASAWEMFIDKAKNSLGARAKYEAFIEELRFSNKLKVPELHKFSDSKLVVNQVTGKFKARGHKMAKYLVVAKSLLTGLKAIKIEQVGRDLNSHADALADQGDGCDQVHKVGGGRTIGLDQGDGCDQVKGLLEQQLKIKFYNSTPSYPQCNKQAKASKKTIMNGIKKRLEKVKGKWVEEMPNVLWAYQTTPRKATNKTPYSLSFGFKTVIPLEVDLPTIQIEAYDTNHNEEVFAWDLDLVEEK